MPPSFGLPPAIQKISPKDDSACAAASALVPLESLTNHAVREAGKAAQGLLQGFDG
jgi:hypothetical protein